MSFVIKKKYHSTLREISMHSFIDENVMVDEWKHKKYSSLKKNFITQLEDR